MDSDGFFEEDEPVEDVLRAFARGPHGITADPRGGALPGRAWFRKTVMTMPTAAVATGFHPQSHTRTSSSAASMA